VQKRFQGFEEPRIRVITTRPFDKLRVTEEKGSRIRGFKDARAKVQSSKLEAKSQKSKSAGFKLQT